MTSRSTKHNLTLGLLVPLLSALTIPAGARAEDHSWRQFKTASWGSLQPESWESARPRFAGLRTAVGDSERFTLCSASDLDLPCRLYSSEELAAGNGPRSYVLETPWPSPAPMPWLDDQASAPWLCGPACGSAWDGAGTTVVEPSCCPRLRWDGSRFRRVCERCSELPAQVCCDWSNFYSCRGLRDLLLGVGVAAVLANTSLDQDFRDWYQARVQAKDLNEFGRAWNDLGDGAYVIPAFVAIAAAGALFDETPLGGDLAELGSRTLRAYLVGAPPVVFGQWALGGARPGESDRGSRWTPFEFTHAISGHAFIGAVPFITAAKMTDCIWLKGGLYGLSVLPGWARVNRDRHYLSQAILGWWIACLSCSAVDQTELSAKGYAVFPLVSPDMAGMGVACSW